MLGTGGTWFVGKYLQKHLASQSIVKISIKFAVVIGVSIICICLIFTYKGTKNISLLQFFGHFSYIELTYNYACTGKTTV